MITTEDTPKILTKKIAAVVSEKIEIGTAMNAVAHMALGLGTALGTENALMCDYVDADGIHHPSISASPFIVLKGRPTKIREAVEAAKGKDIITVDFLNTMTIGSYTEQLVRTKESPNSALDFYGVVFFGETAAVSEITRKFSLFK